MPQYYQGKFVPRNPKKYLGDPSSIIYRSSWELKLMSWLDNYDVCEEWGSEELIIPYRSEVDGKIHRYFPDFVAKMRQPDGTKKILLLEVKPHSQTLVPVIKKSKRKKTMMNEIATYSVNQSKWAAARAFCEDRGWEFKVLTEYDLGILNK